VGGISDRNPVQRKRSLLLITVDCLRADHCGWNGYTRPTTPFLDSLASESFVVPGAIVAGAPTYYSLPAILASRMPLALGRDVIGLAPGETTLATVLRASDYATAAFCAANPYISPRFGYEQGFDVFRDFLELDHSSSQNAALPETGSTDSPRGKVNRSIASVAATLGLRSLYNELYFQYCMRIAPAVESVDALRKYPSADILVDQALLWLASVRERPFFLWLHLMDPHSPYYPTNQAFRELTGRDIDGGRARYLNEYWNRGDASPDALRAKRDDVLELYDAGILCADCQIGRLVQGLKQTSRWDNCVLALTADHGEEFLEHGGRYHAPVALREKIVRVPLLIRVPAERAVKLPASAVSHLHLAPTLLEMIGQPAPPSFHGRSFFTNLRQGKSWDDPAIIECAYGCTNPFRVESRNAPRLLGVHDARFKLVIRLEAGAKEEIYDLETDSAETYSNIGTAFETRKRLLQAAHEHMKRAISDRDSRLRLKARLRDLRYQCDNLPGAELRLE
jgi:arylsulfatase A-like enzyme